jgi:hypothetical protein
MTHEQCIQRLEPTNANLIYCLQFLRNGGEYMRAIRLAKDCLGLSIPEARAFVEGLYTPIRVDIYVVCGGCRVSFAKDDQRLAGGLCPICGEKLYD